MKGLVERLILAQCNEKILEKDLGGIQQATQNAADGVHRRK